MHEYQVTQNIIRTAEEFAAANGAETVAVINLVVGDCSGCVADSIELYFDLIAQGTLCSDARVNIERVSPKLRCKLCGGYFERKPFEFTCPLEGCGGEGEPTEIGREFYIRSIQVK
jgi:hydrogenase nickel incorporation protein HypA/HybF